MKYLLLFAVAFALVGCKDARVQNGVPVSGGDAGNEVRFSEMPNGDRCYTYQHSISCISNK